MLNTGHVQLCMLLGYVMSNKMAEVEEKVVEFSSDTSIIKKLLLPTLLRYTLISSISSNYEPLMIETRLGL